MRKLKIGVFGAARGETMIRVLSRHPDAELVAICDKYEPLLARCGLIADKNQAKVTLYKDFESFFTHDMDAVVLANYATEHAPYAIRLLKSGRHVISELMAAETMGQAVELVEAVEESGCIYAYAENCCYYSGCLEMKRLYREGYIGNFLHGEGEYIHMAGEIWPELTRGERSHWRNNIPSTFYCSHSLGPLLNITGLKPVRVIGMETPNPPYMARKGSPSGASGMIILQLENGATVKSIHGALPRHPALHWFCLYGEQGVMETDRWHHDADRIFIYNEKDPQSKREISYMPRFRYEEQLASHVKDHGGSDFYTMHFFLARLLGRPEGAEMIDIYQALDMSLPGLLAYRSIMQGNSPIDFPNFREKEDREIWRGDNWCTNPKLGDKAVPVSSFGRREIPDSVYDQIRQAWEESQK